MVLGEIWQLAPIHSKFGSSSLGQITRNTHFLEFRKSTPNSLKRQSSFLPHFQIFYDFSSNFLRSCSFLFVLARFDRLRTFQRFMSRLGPKASVNVKIRGIFLGLSSFPSILTPKHSESCTAIFWSRHEFPANIPSQ